METWVPLYGSVFVSQVSHFCSHTLFRMCTCISTYIMSTLLPILAQCLWIVTLKVGCPCVSLCVSQSPCLWSGTLFRMCTCISTCNYVHLTAQVWSRSYAYFDGNLGAPEWQCVCIPGISYPFPHLVYNVYMHQYMNLCPPDCPCLLPPPMHSFMETWVPLCVTVCVSHSPRLCSHTLFRMYTCIST